MSRAGWTRCAACPSRISALPRIDHHRSLRWGFPEVIFCAGKTPEQVAGIAERLAAQGTRLLGTRANAAHYEAARAWVPGLQYHESGALPMAGP